MVGVLLCTGAAFPMYESQPKENDDNLSKADPEHLGTGGFL